MDLFFHWGQNKYQVDPETSGLEVRELDGLETVTLSEVRPRKTNIKCYCLYVESKEMVQMNLFTKQMEWKTTCGNQGGKDGVGRIN